MKGWKTTASLGWTGNLNAFDIDEKEKVARIYLSAEAVDMFKEVRGKGRIDFKSFIINPV